MENHLQLPISAEETRDLRIGDAVLLSGTLITGRDLVYKWLYDTFISKTRPPAEEDNRLLAHLQSLASGGAIYHCGPVVSGMESGNYRFVAAGPTTSIREEAYESDVIRLLNLRGVIGKGGMGDATLRALQEAPAVYFHAVGGAACLIAASVVQVLEVCKPEFGMPEALWVIKVKDLPVIVTMDSHGSSLHATVRSHSKSVLDQLIA